MGLDLRVSTDSDEVEIRLGRGETEAIKLLRATLSAQADAVFGVEDFGKPSTIVGEAFLAAATALLKAVESSGQEAGRMYYLQMEDSGDGVRLPGSLPESAANDTRFVPDGIVARWSRTSDGRTANWCIARSRTYAL